MSVHIQTLPELVLVNILRFLPWTYNCEFKSFKQKLPFLAICHDWRQAALSQVYSNLVIKDLTINDYTSNNVHVVIHTNSKLIRDTGNCELVTKLTIYIRDATLYTGKVKLGILLALFLDSSKLSSGYWNNFVPTSYYIEEHKAQMEPIIVKEFSQQLPNIIDLDIRVNSRSTLFAQINTELIMAYFDQLRSLVSCVKNIPSMTHFPPNLVRLEFDCCVRWRCIPVINPQTIQYLRLLNTPTNFKWHRNFGGHTDNSQCLVRCPNLAHLDLSFSSYQNTASQLERQETQVCENTEVLQLPQLRCLKIGNGQNDRINFYPDPQTMPSHLNYLRLYANAKSLSGFCQNLPIKSVGQLDISILGRLVSSDTDVFCRATNAFLGGIKVEDKALVDLPNIPANLKPKNLYWTNLTCLNIYLMSIDDIAILMPRTPQIDTLAIYTLCGSMSRGNWKLSELGRCKLRAIYICEIDRSVFDKEEQAAGDLLEIICNLKQLELMSVSDDIKTILRDGFRKMKHVYPHLAKLAT